MAYKTVVQELRLGDRVMVEDVVFTVTSLARVEADDDVILVGVKSKGSEKTEFRWKALAEVPGPA
jgi:hypothetical protein